MVNYKMNKEIKNGMLFTPKDKGNFYYGNIMRVIKVTSQDNDGFIYWKSDTPIKYKRRWNKGKCRVWWFKEYCYEVIEEMKGGNKE